MPSLCASFSFALGDNEHAPITPNHNIRSSERSMEFSLSGPSQFYRPGDILSGTLKYDITAQQETILDARIHLNGSVLIHPTKHKYESYRMSKTFLEESQTLFQGPFTLKRQELSWTFNFTLPTMSTIDESLAPLPPSMDHQFREGLLIRVAYNITATIRTGSDHKSAKQASKIVLVKPPMNPAISADRSYNAMFPPIEILRKDLSNHSRLRFWNKSSSSKNGSDLPPHTLHLEMRLPSTLSSSQHDAITCCLKDDAEKIDDLHDTTFVLEICELVLRSRSTWHNLLEESQHVGTVTMRPDIRLKPDGKPATTSDTIGLQDFITGRRMPSSLESYDLVLPPVSQESTLTVTAILRNQESGHRIHTKSTTPVFVLASNTQTALPPAYDRVETAEEVVPPAYETLPDT